MAENVLTECPATPDLDQCPSTPDRIINVKSPISNAASSDTEGGAANNTRTGAESPPPNCAICLERCENKCFTDSCLHQFCFKCLLEWSKVKAECPLCKQPFKSIIHNVKAIDQFEEYLVGQPQATSNIPLPIPLPLPMVSGHHAHITTTNYPLQRMQSTYTPRLDVFLGDLPRTGFSATVQVHPTGNSTMREIFLHRSALMERYRQEYPHEVIPPASLGIIWRRYIYDRRLYAMPVVDITGRYRESTARFYRDNPAQIHRLMPWLNRDVVCLLRDSEHHVSYVLNVISELMTIFNITSSEFRRRCQTYFRSRTSHFIHEFLNFARSPYDMPGYDREVRYSPFCEEVILTSGSEDVEDLTQRRRGNRARRGTIDGQTTSNVASTSRSGLDLTINVGTETGGSAQQQPVTIESGGEGGEEERDVTQLGNAASPVGDNQPQILGQSSVIQIGVNIELSSSSSDECEFVLEQKPPHMRTPEQVSLGSDSDSDVVFVSEFKSKVSSSPNVSPGNSSSQGAVVGRCSSRKRKLTPKSNANHFSTTDDEDEAGPPPKTETKLSEARSMRSLIKDEYNNGASTSSGLGRSTVVSSEGSSRIRPTKFYARPVRQTYGSRKQKNVKTIFESSSDKSSDNSSSSSSNSDSSSSSDSDSSWSISKNRSKTKQQRTQSKARRRKEVSSKKKKKSKRSNRRKKTTVKRENHSPPPPPPPPQPQQPKPTSSKQLRQQRKSRTSDPPLSALISPTKISIMTLSKFSPSSSASSPSSLSSSSSSSTSSSSTTVAQSSSSWSSSD